MLKIDLNCDIGESTSLRPYSIDYDISLLPYFSSINLACGFHAGDSDTIIHLVREAAALNISIGAHPSFPDRENFGRKEMALAEEELYSIVYEQIVFVASLALSQGARLQHVKPHGALYNMSARDHRMAFILCSAVQAYDEDLMIYGLAGSEVIKVANTMGMRSCNEVFADRRYSDDGTLVPRSEPNAVIDDPVQALEQARRMAIYRTVESVTGKTIFLNTETICIHSDGKYALRFAKTVNEALRQHGIIISHP
jgi:5-oxoprolinase (ATP-hydrolysing) subunit A